MPLATGDIIGILVDNLRLRGSVLPLSPAKATQWTRGLELPRGGETVLYTGQMYQLIPYIEGLVKAEKQLGNSFLARYTNLGRRLNRFVNISAFMARPSSELRDLYNEIPRHVVALLRKAEISFGYLYEDDLYSGALAYDLGAEEAVAEHARKVFAVLTKYGVKNLITIDPHTTNMLRSVYPQLVPGYDLQVKTYLEVLAKKSPHLARPVQPTQSTQPSQPEQGQVVIHDPCVFARYENVIDEPRQLLAAAGLTVCEPARAKRLTWCCGGPIEALYPEKAAANAARRIEQLQAAGSEVATMCPLCLVNLSTAAAAGMKFIDISEYLYHAFCA